MDWYQSFSINYTMIRETVLKFIILSDKKIRSRILQFRVGSENGWFRKVRLVKFNREPAVGQFGLLSWTSLSQVG